MKDNLILQIFLIGAGIFSIVSSICNFDFYFESRKARLFVSVFGRNGARVFYGLLGLFLIILGVRTF